MDTQPSLQAYHEPVLVSEVTTLLAGAGRVLDCTVGGGGHARALLEAGVSVVGIDQDPEALEAAQQRLAAFVAPGLFRAVLANFADTDAADGLRGERFDGILLDLGVSSHQLDDFGRGFTFRPGATLDMRMSGTRAGSAGRDGGMTAAQLLNASDERELAVLFREYGDEPHARRLARIIVARRARVPFRTSDDLVGAIRAAMGPRTGHADFARLFQAVRIAVNDELGALRRALPALREILAPAGIMAVIAYHSGEDRIVKHTFRDWSVACVCPPRQPICTCGGRALGALVTRKAVTATPVEVAANPRARSAHLRAWRKTA